MTKQSRQGDDRLLLSSRMLRFARNDSGVLAWPGAIFIATGLAICAAAAPAQYLETTIPLYDSLGLLDSPHLFCLDTVRDRIFVDDGNTILVLDASTNKRIARIGLPVETDTMVYNPFQNKVYCLSSYENRIVVVDAALNRVVTELPTDSRPTALCYSPGADRILCASGDTVVVLNCSNDSVVAVIPDRYGPWKMCCDATGSKVCCLNCSSNLSIVDIDSNRVVATVPVGLDPISLCLDPVRNRVYCANYGSDDITTVDCAANRVVGRVSDVPTPAALCYHPATDAIFCACADYPAVYAINCRTDSVSARIPADYGDMIVCDPDGNRVYCSYDEGPLTVIDAVTDSMVARVNYDLYPSALLFDPVGNRLYSLSSDYDELAVI